MKPIARLLRAYFTLGTIVAALPNNILDGQAVDAVPVMADFNWIVSQVNANGAALTDLATTNAAVSALQAKWGTLTNFTPVLLFGGANVGMTFVNQIGRSLILGPLVFFWIEVSISAKGASTGAATVGGLPATINAAMTSTLFPLSISSFGVDYTMGGVSGGPAIPKAQLTPGSTTISLGTSLKDSTSGFGQYLWSDVQFAAASAVRLSGCYAQ